MFAVGAEIVNKMGESGEIRSRYEDWFGPIFSKLRFRALEAATGERILNIYMRSGFFLSFFPLGGL
jgi:hypothetical protein